MYACSCLAARHPEHTVPAHRPSGCSHRRSLGPAPFNQFPSFLFHFLAKSFIYRFSAETRCKFFICRFYAFRRGGRGTAPVGRLPRFRFDEPQITNPKSRVLFRLPPLMPLFAGVRPLVPFLFKDLPLLFAKEGGGADDPPTAHHLLPTFLAHRSLQPRPLAARVNRR